MDYQTLQVTGVVNACAVAAAKAVDRRTSFLIADASLRFARASEKRRLVLRFLRDEIWTCTEIVGLLLGITYPAAHTLLKATRRDRLTVSSEVFIAGKRGVQRTLLHGITAQGLAYAWDIDEVPEPRNPWEPSKTNALFVPHNIETQRARLRAEKQGCHSWRPARSLMRLGLPKLPDGEMIDQDGLRVAVEIEREIKTDRRYESVIGAYVAQMKKDGRWERVDYLCPDADFAMRLARVFGRLHQLRLEGQSGSPAKVGSLEQAHLDRFRFYASDAWPNGEFIVATKQTKK